MVVVESHERGGSLITARHAADRGVPVLAVPGSLRSEASLGTNQLIVDGCAPCLSIDDVVMAIGLSGGAGALPSSGQGTPRDPDAARVLEAMGWEPATIDELAGRFDIDIVTLSVALARLQDEGYVAGRLGRFERVGVRS